MQMDSLYTILETSGQDQHFEAIVQLDPAHEIFTGHFPGQPVVPGVAMIRMIRAVAEKITGHALQLSEARNVKFLNIVDPDKNKILRISGSLKGGDHREYTINANVSHDDTIYLKFKGVFIIFVSGD